MDKQTNYLPVKIRQLTNGYREYVPVAHRPTWYDRAAQIAKDYWLEKDDSAVIDVILVAEGDLIYFGLEELK